MTSSELKELVKSHFNLVEAEVAPETVVEEVNETFGELKDINGAFTIKFPGDSIQVGDKVSVVTAEGQEMDAPDGTHEMEDGTKIVTKDSVVEEIMGADGEKALSEVEMAEEEVTEEAFEEVTEEVAEEVMEDIAEVSIEDVVAEIADALKEEMGRMKEKMAELEEKVSKVYDAPAAESTKMASAPAPKAKFAQFNVEEAANASRIKLALDLIKNKKK
jgi:hypothetical protein